MKYIYKQLVLALLCVFFGVEKPLALDSIGIGGTVACYPFANGTEKQCDIWAMKTTVNAINTKFGGLFISRV